MANLSNAFISVNDIVNNFIISYTGPGKIIPDTQRTEVVFHARRCLQEFAYETLKSQMTDTTTVPGSPYVYNFPTDLVAIIKVTVDSVEFTESSSSSPLLLSSSSIDACPKPVHSYRVTFTREPVMAALQMVSMHE